MAAKQIVFDEQPRDALHEGVNILGHAVRTTLGPKGRNVALGKQWGAPTISPGGGVRCWRATRVPQIPRATASRCDYPESAGDQRACSDDSRTRRGDAFRPTIRSRPPRGCSMAQSPTSSSATAWRAGLP